MPTPRLRRVPLRIVGLVQAVVLSLVLAVESHPAGADGQPPSGGPNHVVLAFNTADGHTQPRSGVAVAMAAGPVVTSENLALAQSSACTGCRTVAVAVQAVFVTRNANVVAPTNAAVAVNAGCFDCDTMAAAYQYVASTSGPVYLSAAGQQRVAELRAEIAAVAASDLAFQDLEAQLDLLVQQLWTTLDQELQQAGPGASVAAGRTRDVELVAA